MRKFNSEIKKLQALANEKRAIDELPDTITVIGIDGQGAEVSSLDLKIDKSAITLSIS